MWRILWLTTRTFLSIFGQPLSSSGRRDLTPSEFTVFSKIHRTHLCFRSKVPYNSKNDRSVKKTESCKKKYLDDDEIALSDLKSTTHRDANASAAERKQRAFLCSQLFFMNIYVRK